MLQRIYDSGISSDALWQDQARLALAFAVGPAGATAVWVANTASNSLKSEARVGLGRAGVAKGASSVCLLWHEGGVANPRVTSYSAWTTAWKELSVARSSNCDSRVAVLICELATSDWMV